MPQSHTVLAVAAVCCLMATAAALPPLPSRFPGFSKDTGSAVGTSETVWIEGFLDLMCPDSKASWPVVKQVLAAYGDKVAFTFHQFPLPYHHNAFFAAQATHAVAAANSSAVWDWIDAAFAQQSMFYNLASNNTTPNNVIKEMANIAGSVGVPLEPFMHGMWYDNDLDEDTRVAWKYGCTRGVYGTPTFFVNGLRITGDSGSWDLAQWQALINPLMEG